MIQRKNLSAILCVLFAAAMIAQAKERPVVIRITNPADVARTEEVVAVPLETKELLSLVQKSVGIAVSEIKTKNVLVHQIVDENGDGTPDMLFFQADVLPKETKDILVSGLKKVGEPFQTKTDARFVPPREDLAWENERNAFRMYGPALAKDVNNGIDVWTKRVRYPIVAKWYAESSNLPPGQPDSYHQDHGEGADFFSVGRTLGAGSCAISKFDSLYQPGVFESYRILATGPLVAMFELTYPSFVYDGKNVIETKQITLTAGSNLNRIRTSYHGEDAEGDITVVAGLVKRAGISVTKNRASAVAAVWGPTNDQPENEFLGTGIVVPKKTLLSLEEDSVHVMAFLKGQLGKTLEYYAGAGWTRSGDFKNEAEWIAYLTQYANRIQNPVVVEIR